MSKLYNRARMTITSTGTGALSLGVAVAGYQTFSSSGAQNGDTISYTIEDGLNWEIGTGSFNSVAGTLSRTVTQSYDGTTYGTSAISVTIAAQVFITALAADLTTTDTLTAGTLPVVRGGTGLTSLGTGVTTALGNSTNSASGLAVLNGSGYLSVAQGGTGLGSLTSGYIPFGAGTSAFDNSANLFWDNTNARLGIGTSSPAFKADINGTTRSIGSITVNTGRTVSGGTGGCFLDSTGINNDFVSTGRAAALPAGWATVRINQVAGTDGLALTGDTSQTANYMRVASSTGSSIFTINSSGNVGIGTSSPASKLQIGSSSTSTQAENIDMWGALAGSDGDIGRLRFFNVNAFGNKIVAQVSGARNGNNYGGALIFSTGTQADTTLTERVRIDSSGNVGIGTSSPSSYGKFVSVNGSSYVSLQASVYNTAYFGPRPANDGFCSIYCSWSATNNADNMWMYDYSSSYMCISQKVSGTVNERMRIDTSGNLLVGTTSQGGSYNGRFVTSTGSGLNGILVKDTQANGAIASFVNSSNAQAGTITISGTSTTYGTSSDISLKENITQASSSLASILALPIRQFNWKSDGSHTDYGVVAQEANDYAPEMVARGDVWQVDYGRITPRLIKAFQELAAKVSVLEAKQ